MNRESKVFENLITLSNTDLERLERELHKPRWNKDEVDRKKNPNFGRSTCMIPYILSLRPKEKYKREKKKINKCGSLNKIKKNFPLKRISNSFHKCYVRCFVS